MLLYVSAHEQHCNRGPLGDFQGSFTDRFGGLHSLVLTTCTEHDKVRRNQVHGIEDCVMRVPVEQRPGRRYRELSCDALQTLLKRGVGAFAKRRNLLVRGPREELRKHLRWWQNMHHMQDRAERRGERGGPTCSVIGSGRKVRSS
jgi:hypothetical protein